MSINQRKYITLTLSVILVFGLFISIDNVYAANKASSSKIKSYKKSIKSYNAKTQHLAKATPAAKKLAQKTKSYYKKSKQTKKIKTLQTLKTKTKKTYNNAQKLDYNRQTKDIYLNIKDISYQAPSLNTYTSRALAIYNQSRSSKSLTTIKKNLSKIKTVYKNGKAHKATLTWHEAEYRYEYVEGHYEKVIIQQAEYKLMNVSYYVAMASSNGYQTGSTYSWNLNTCLQNGSVFPFSSDISEMKTWGCIWYIDDKGIGHDIIPISESTAYAKYLISLGLSTQSRETVEWFQTKEEISEQKWIEPYTKTILIRNAGWY